MNFFGYTLDTVSTLCFLVIISPFIIGVIVRMFMSIIKKLLYCNKIKIIITISNKLVKKVKRGVK